MTSYDDVLCLWRITVIALNSGSKLNFVCYEIYVINMTLYYATECVHRYVGDSVHDIFVL